MSSVLWQLVDVNSPKTDWVAGKRREETGTRLAEPWARDYRIRYYLSSEKLRPVD